MGMKHTTTRCALSLILAFFLSSSALCDAQMQPATEPASKSSADSQSPNDPFRINGKPPQVGYLTRSNTPIPRDLLDSEMVTQISRLISNLEPRSFSGLRRSVSTTPVDQSTISGLADSSILAYLHLQRDEHLQTYELHHGDAKFYILRSISDPSQTWQIQVKAFDRLNIDMNWPTQSDAERETADQEIAGGTRFVMPQPYIESTTKLDLRTLRARIKNRYPNLTRQLENELFRVRLPKNYNPESPAGILLWISPMEDGRIPKIFEPSLDELGLIAIGIDNNGNARPITDRLQNHLDSVETIAQQYRIDRSRIYLTGMSGGGRCSSILQIAFPDLFAGAVPIVGLDTYHQAPTGDPGKFWPARLGKPAAKWMRLLKAKRIAAITGTADFNQPEMSIRKDLLNRDGIEMRLDIIEGMSHSMPTADQFTSALTWVDEPRSKENEDARLKAQELLTKYAAKFGESDHENPIARKILVEVITLAPWTDAAWDAMRIFGYDRPD